MIVDDFPQDTDGIGTGNRSKPNFVKVF